MKILSGQELSDFIKERQAGNVRSLIRSGRITPKLAIITTLDNPATDLNTSLNKQYGEDIGVAIDVYKISQKEVPAKLKTLNSDSSVHGISLQLPSDDSAKTSRLVNMVSPDKDVNGLGAQAEFDSPTPIAIMWLIAAYNIDLSAKQVLIVGEGILALQLKQMFGSSGISVNVAASSTGDLKNKTLEADVIVSSASGSAIFSPDMIKPGAIVIDNNEASEDGKIVSGVAEAVYERDDLTITPKEGGVSPLTISAIFENVILAAKRKGAS